MTIITESATPRLIGILTTHIRSVAIARTTFLEFMMFFVTLACISKMQAAVIENFDAFNDGDTITNQVPGLTFENTVVLTSGISLNEFEFPPFSGSNVASDNGGPLSIALASPATNFSGYFTYTVPLTLRAFDLANTEVASISSLFSNNLALSGTPGSQPNEPLQLAFAGGISRVTITGDPAGGSFTLDDAAFTSAIPEPGSLSLVVAGIGVVFGIRQFLPRRINAQKRMGRT